MSKGAFTPEFTPVARPGNLVSLDTGEQVDTFEIERFAALPEVPADTISVDANSHETDIELTGLEVWDQWLAQYRLLDVANQLPEGVRLELDHGGKQAPAWIVQNQRGSSNRSTGVETAYDEAADSVEVVENHSHLTELFIHEQDVPYLTVYNDSGSQVDVDLVFSGFKFQLKSPTHESETPVQVPVENVRGQ